jgi:NAD(P)-dependent dehydrogenase (short-subunit alcohol dehydrogenase family)
MLLASRGAKVVIVTDHSGSSDGEAVAREILTTRGHAKSLSARIGNDEDAIEIVRKTIEYFGRIDIIIHSAVVAGGDTSVEDEPAADFEAQLDFSIRGPMQLNRAVWPFMAAQKYGRILFTGSAASLGWYRTAHGYQGSYPIAKAGVFGLARQTAASGHDLNIKANILLPWAYTQMAQTAVSDFARWMKENLPAVSVARGSALLLHELCPVTGQAISIAGGRITRIFFASPKGYFNRDFTPEDILDNWALIEGTTGPDGFAQDVSEISSQPRERDIIRNVNSEA